MLVLLLSTYLGFGADLLCVEVYARLEWMNMLVSSQYITYFHRFTFEQVQFLSNLIPSWQAGISWHFPGFSGFPGVSGKIFGNSGPDLTTAKKLWFFRFDYSPPLVDILILSSSMYMKPYMIQYTIAHPNYGKLQRPIAHNNNLVKNNVCATIKQVGRSNEQNSKGMQPRWYPSGLSRTQKRRLQRMRM
jgi:hypothetical protein